MVDNVQYWDGQRWNGPITDGHMHLDRNGRFLDAILDFERSGGTRIILVHKPNFSNLPSNKEEILAAYLDTLSIAEEVRNNSTIAVQVVLGPHPVVWVHQLESLGVELSTELHLMSIDLALNFHSKGECVAIGEIGRPHFPVSPDVWNFANEMLEEVLRKCASQNVPVQFHVESNGSTTCHEITEICKNANYPVSNGLRHYAPANVSPFFTSNLPVTVSMGRGSVEKIARTIDFDLLFSDSHPPVLMETDYLDDPKRPGAVLGPRTIPKRTNELGRFLQLSIEEGGLGWSHQEINSFLWKIHKVWPDLLYGECR